MVFLFWLVVALIVTHYFLLPVTLFLLAKLIPKIHEPGRNQPTVDLIIAAYNEARVIEKKLRNCGELSYPPERIEVMVVSDGSTDETPKIVERMGGAKSLFESPRQGKSNALNRAVASTEAEILLFSDANTFYRPDSVGFLMRHFSDPQVGGVSGLKKILQKAGRASARGDQTYWSLESMIKEWQSSVGSVSTADGEIFAMRRSLWRPLDPAVINDDMALTLAIIQQGKRVLYEPAAVSEEDASITLWEDFHVKARMVAGGYQFFLNLWKTEGALPTPFLIQILLHKFLRYAMPILLIALLVSNLFLLREPIYFAALLMQITFYACAMLGALLRAVGLSPILFYLPLYYCVVNAAALMGLLFFLRRTALTNIWSKANR
ncbi:MAG: glycosyltransferase family 2 protein [Deltaproteobacteria bacterium]|nr:glycosyltransferase family 2 protein [Deltaproteobacteria bacterium]MBI3295068.1 glycosyltransferase family 2 protein [Deltaproteobacteria bacterium]